MKCAGLDPATNEALEIRFDSVITGVDPLLDPPPGLPYLAPGFIDIQVNGFAGADYCTPETSIEAIARSLDAQLATGVTRLLATVVTNSPEAIAGSLRRLADARETLPRGRAIEGFHVEGPHISPDPGPVGAHPPHWVRPPDLDEFRRWQEAARGQVRLVTLAPEWPQALPYIEVLVREGVVVSIGHTNANSAQIQDAVRAGATLSTHLGNGSHATIRRHPNYIWDQLAEDALAASFIFDGTHLPPAFMKVALRAKGIERSILITDAVAPAGCPPGRYRLGDVDVILHEHGPVTLLDGQRLAGSAVHMNRSLVVAVTQAGATLAEALAMVTRNPARVARIAGRQRGLAPGDRADIVQFRWDRRETVLRVENTWLGGELVHSSGTAQ
jgi:N-acetylglucosamine-6-phosphate deacetylase